jgi:hypothetical protein
LTETPLPVPPFVPSGVPSLHDADTGSVPLPAVLPLTTV